MKTYNKYKLSHLKMVYPPLSNKEAIHMEENPVSHIEDKIGKSDFYMICAKPRGFFFNHMLNENDTLTFDLMISGNIVDSGEIVFKELGFWDNYESDLQIKVECGKDYIFILDSSKSDFNVIERFSPENILWYRSRNMKGVLGLNKFKDLNVYDLLYVGIAKVGDSYTRLIKNGHKTRMKILAKEEQRTDGVRVTEETFLMFFKVEPLVITQYNSSHSFTNDDIYPQINLKKVVADAEKAFVSLLKPKYNITRFKEYPKGKDGLYKSEYDKYSYSIAETLILNTPHGQIQGDYSEFTFSNDADSILIDGDNVGLYLASK